jgi:hypothetical protein
VLLYRFLRIASAAINVRAAIVKVGFAVPTLGKTPLPRR